MTLTLSSDQSSPSPRSSAIRKTAFLFLVLALAGAFGVMYSRTFSGFPIAGRTHGPFNFECGVYRSYARGELKPGGTDNDKLQKHLLCALGYPVIYRVLEKIFTSPPPFSVCSFLAALTLLAFGWWLSIRTAYSPVVFPVMLLLGFSFNTWYVGSIWESRAFIMFGAVVLLISLDRLIRRPGVGSYLLAVLATIFSLLITFGNAYLLPLGMVALLTRAGRLGPRRAFLWTIAFPCLVLGSTALVYQVSGELLNPNLRLDKVVKLSRHEQKHIHSTVDRFNGANIGNVARQALVYSVGGLYLPCGDRMCDREWANPRSPQAYFYYLRSAIFINGYALIAGLELLTVLWKNLWLKEPLLWVLAAWCGLYISFFVYFNPWAGPVYAAELMPVLWAGFGLVLARLSTRKALVILFLLAAVLAWNNYLVLRYFAYHYGGDKKTSFLITPPPRGAPAKPVFRPGGV